MWTFWVYMLLCSDGHYYIGVTNDVERRVAQHNLGEDVDCYTFKRRPVRLVYASEFRDIRDAIAWEKHIKRWSRAKKAALLRGDYDEIGRLARGKTVARTKRTQ
jgi:putative endonuclease